MTGRRERQAATVVSAAFIGAGGSQHAVAGVLVLSLSYGIGGPIVTVAMLSLALNLALTGVFILIVKRLIDGVPERLEVTQPAPGWSVTPGTRAA